MTNTEEIKKLRKATGLGILLCQKILKETGSDFKKALSLAKEKLKNKAIKRGGRETKEGVIASYIHSNKKVGVLVEVLCETDFVAKNEEFLSLASDLAVHIAAMEPEFIGPEKEVASFLNEQKETKVLLEQNYFKDPSKKVKDLIVEKIEKLGENIRISRFVRYQI